MDRATIIIALVSLNAALSRALREDVRFFPSLKAPWRDVTLALATLVLAPALDTMVLGTPIATALWTALAAALPNLIKLIVALFATPQSDLQVSAQKLANTEAAKKSRGAGISGAALLALALSAPLALMGCKAALPIIAEIISDAGEAAVLLEQVADAERAFFAKSPNAALQEKIENAIAKARTGVDVAYRTGRGARDLSQQDAAGAFAEFRVAWTELEQLLTDAGIAQRQGKMLAVRGGARLQLPTPLALEAK